jgi:hypothetical protein
MRISIIFLILLFFQISHAGNTEISMVCNWVTYSANQESFVFNIEKNEVYWVNENQRIKLTEKNEGRIVFSGTKSKVRVTNITSKFGGVPVDEPYKVLTNTELKFIINRVTGNLGIEGIELPEGYKNYCVTKQKII